MGASATAADGTFLCGTVEDALRAWRRERGEASLVSIVVPTYNTPPDRLARAVASMTAQTHRNVEVILVDDGSEGDCREAVRRVAASDGRLRLVEGGHGGVSHARNLGIGAARGDWVAFADADDEVEPAFLEEALAVAAAAEADLVCGWVTSLFEGWDKNEQDCGDGSYVAYGDTCDLTSAMWQMLGHMKCAHFMGPDFRGRGPVAKLYRRTAIGDLRFDEGISIGEDTLFNYRMIERCGRAAWVERRWYWYWQYADSTMRSVDLSKWEASIAGILGARRQGEDAGPFMSRCAFMTWQCLDALIMSKGVRGARAEGLEILDFAWERGCFGDGAFRGFRMGKGIPIMLALCRAGRFGAAYAFYAARDAAKRMLRIRRLYAGESPAAKLAGGGAAPRL